VNRKYLGYSANFPIGVEKGNCISQEKRAVHTIGLHIRYQHKFE